MKQLARDILIAMVLLLMLCVKQGIAQELFVEEYTEKDGLGSSNIMCFYKDKRGYLWLGTEGNGVKYFNGVSFADLSADFPEMDNDIYDITEDDKGNLWLAAYNKGLYKYNGTEVTHIDVHHQTATNEVWSVLFSNDTLWAGQYGGITMITPNDTIKYLFNNVSGKPLTITRLLKDSKGILYACTHGRGVFRFNGNEFVAYKPEIIQGIDVVRDMEDINGTLLVGTNRGLVVVDPQGNTLQEEGIYVYSITEKSNNEAIVTAQEGVYRYNLLTNELKELGDVGYKNCISSFVDDQSNIWLGTYGNGLLKLSEDFFTVIENDSIQNFISNVYHDVVLDEVYVATFGEGIFVYDSLRNLKNYYEEPSKASTVIKDNLGRIWLGGYGQGVYCQNGSQFDRIAFGDSKMENRVLTLFCDQNNNIWVGTLGEGVFCIEPGVIVSYQKPYTALLDNTVSDIVQTDASTYWMATDKGISCFRNGEFKNYPTNEVKVVCLAVDDAENIWFGTESGLGVLLKTQEGYQIQQYLFENEVFANSYIQFLKFDQSILWIGARNGLFRMDIDELSNSQWQTSSFFKISKDQNLEISSYSKGGHSDTLWFGARNIIAGLSLKDSIRIEPPKLYLTAVNIFDEEGIVSNEYDSLSNWFEVPFGLRLPYHKNNLVFEFDHVDFDWGENTRYYYQLHPIDTIYHVTKENNLTAAYLPPGEYTLRMYAVNGASCNSEELNFSFVITPPFWRTYWFYSVVLIFIVLSVLLYIRLRTWRLNQRNKILQLLVRKKTKELHEERKALIAAKDQAIKSENAKQEMFANVSHEIRTPINVILGLSNLMEKKNGVTEGGKDYITMLKQSSQYLMIMVNNILDFEKIEKNEFYLGITAFKTDAPIRFVESVFLLEAQQKGLEFIVEIDERLPTMIVGDEYRLCQILQNIVGNAIKFTHQGRVVLTATLEKEDEMQCAIGFRVQDTGVGIEQERVDKIFDRFHTTTAKTSIFRIKEISKGLELDLQLPRK